MEIAAVFAFAAVVAVVGIRLGMLVAPRLDRLTDRADEDLLRAADGADTRADERADTRADERVDDQH